jgi:hypothetical protein
MSANRSADRKADSIANQKANQSADALLAPATNHFAASTLIAL